jgi:hypothetical protein
MPRKGGNKMPGEIRIGTTSGMRGMFAVMYDDDGPIQTGLTCKDFKQVKTYAIEWAKTEFGEEWQKHCDVDE